MRQNVSAPEILLSAFLNLMKKEYNLKQFSIEHRYGKLVHPSVPELIFTGMMTAAIIPLKNIIYSNGIWKGERYARR